MNKNLFYIELFLNTPLRFLLSNRKRRKLQRKWAYHQYNFEALCKLNSVFRSLNIPYWLDFGTLLGIYRNNDFIPHDIDLDIGLYHEDYSEDIEKKMVEAGFKKDHEFWVADADFGQESCYTYNGMTVDLFFYKKEEGDICCYEFDRQDKCSFEESIDSGMGLIVKEIRFKDRGLKKLSFREHSFWIPKDSREYLSAHYGEDFMAPQKRWKATVGKTNVTILDGKKGMMKHY